MNNLTMHDPLLLDMLTNMYFGTLDPYQTTPDQPNRKHNHMPPTVPGLALFIGFNRTGDVLDTLKDHQSGTNKYPQASISILLRALTRMEDYYLTNGLESRIPPQLVKFVMNAYHGVVEKKAQDDTPNTAIQIVFEAPKELDHNKTRTDPLDQLQQLTATAATATIPTTTPTTTPVVNIEQP